jgi:hypothetical protein
MIDLYFDDVDAYVSVEPTEFENVVVADQELGEAVIGVLESANDLDSDGLNASAARLDGLIQKLAAKYQGRTVTLNKPFRTPKGPKKFSVYVKNEKGNVVKVNFGDPNMEIKKDIPARRKSFRARHNCDSPGPKWKARYWSCRAW